MIWLFRLGTLGNTAENLLILSSEIYCLLLHLMLSGSRAIVYYSIQGIDHP
jgi:hypothetical protein